MLKTLVKANSVTNLTDARYFAAWEVNWLGFCLDPDSPDFVNHPQALAIRDWIGGVDMVGEFGAQEPSLIVQIADKLQLDAIQLSRPIPQEWLPDLPKIPLIQELAPSHDISSGELQAQLMAYGPHVSYFLLDFTRHRLTWEEIQEEGAPLPVGLLRSFCSEYPILLSFDWRPGNLEEILFHLAPSGICIRGGEEEKTGFKSFEEMDALFEALQVEE